MEGLERFYGKIELGPTGVPTAKWERANLVTFPAPYPMVASWSPSTPITKIRCHRLVQPSLSRALTALWRLYPTAEQRRAAGVDLYGGCFSFRRIAGSDRLSCHAFACAIDLDPGRNPLGKPWEVGMIPMEVVDVFETEGAEWGGRWKRRPDCQHFQWATTMHSMSPIPMPNE